MNRRGFLTGMAFILAAGVAPAALPSGIIMPIRKLWTPPQFMDGVVYHDGMFFIERQYEVMVWSNGTWDAKSWDTSPLLSQ